MSNDRSIWHFNQLFRLRQYPVGEPHIYMSGSLAGSVRNLASQRKLSLITPLIFTNEEGSIEVPMRNFNGLGLVAMADSILKRHQVVAEFCIPYLPFGRHDRRESEMDGLPIDIVTRILDGVDVLTIDPHSPVSQNPFRAISQRWFVNKLLEEYPHLKYKIPIISDAGATAKAYTWAELFREEPIQCHKVRDPETGRLSGFSVNGEHVLDGHQCIIVDDICDGGGTFAGVAALLKTQCGAGDIDLAVPHGFFTKGLDAMRPLIKEFYSLDYNLPVWSEDDRNDVRVLETKRLL